jgi:flagellar hook-length control protein FliK
VQSGLNILLNPSIFGLCLSSSATGNKNCGCEALKGEGESFLSTLMGVAGDKNIGQSKGFVLPQLGKSGNINKILESNKLGIELQEGELDLNENILSLKALKELGTYLPAANGNNKGQDLSTDPETVIPQKAFKMDSEELETVNSKEETNPSEKMYLADLLKALEAVSLKLEGEAPINNLVCDASKEPTSLISEKIFGVDFEKLEAEISKGETNPSEKMYLADLLKALEAVSSKLEAEISKGETNSSKKIHLADLLKSLAVELTDSEKAGQKSGKESVKNTINTEEKAPVAGKIVLGSEAQEVKIAKDLGKGKALEGETPKLKYEPQNTKGVIIESGNLEKDFINSHSDRAGSDKGQDALLLSNNQLSAKVSSGTGQTEPIETFQKQFQTEVLTQIVKKASLNLKDGHTEIKIELKPEFLGHIRMRVASENQQVMVRMLTELPMVKEIIESNIHQLKADLQNQGLEVDKFEVFVSKDSEQFIGERENTASQETRSQSDDKDKIEEIPAGEVEEINQLVGKYNGSALIRVFA